MSVAVSLIVPVYNMEQYLREFLNSVKAQTFTEFEAVLVDDGSTDGSPAILDEYAKGDARFKVVHKENGGSVSARKRGIAESSGKYLSFADPDDIMLPEMLETQYKSITENNADIVVNGYKDMRDGKLSNRKCNRWGLSCGVYDGDKLEDIKKIFFGDGNGIRKRQAFRFFTWNKMFKRELMVDNLDYSPEGVRYGDDFCMVLSAVYDSKRVVFVSSPLYIYREHDKSITKADFSPSEIENIQTVYDAVVKLATDKGYMYDYIKYAYPINLIKRLITQISESRTSKKQKKAHLKELAKSPFVKGFNIKLAKKYTDLGQRAAVSFLKLGIYSPLIRHYKK